MDRCGRWERMLGKADVPKEVKTRQRIHMEIGPGRRRINGHILNGFQSRTREGLALYEQQVPDVPCQF